MRNGRAAEVVRLLGGCAHRDQILRHTTQHALETAVRDGDLRRVARGTYALPDAPPALEAARALGGVISHGSAAAHWLLEQLRPAAQPHVTLHAHAHRAARRGVVVHYADLAHQDDLDGVTSPLRTVLDCAATLPFPEGLAVADSALRLDVVGRDELRRAADERRGPGALRCRRVAEHADGRADNPFESALRAALLGAGSFAPQVEIATPGGVHRVDLADTRRGVVAEADSFAFHGGKAALERDCRRYDELVSSGWLVLRFSWDQVLHDPAWVTAVTRRTCGLRSGRWNGRGNPR